MQNAQVSRYCLTAIRGLSLSRNYVNRLTDRFDMTLPMLTGRKIPNQTNRDVNGNNEGACSFIKRGIDGISMYLVFF